MPERSRLVTLKVRNLGCIGPAGLEVSMDDIVCLVGRNNTGKSTILRAYELAQGNKEIMENEWCQWCPPGQGPEVELSVHVPDGIMNVDDKWKMKSGDLKLVLSRWQWKAPGEKPVRQTWDPEGNEGQGAWAEGEKAGGADNVFKSRLPQPLRVASLGDATSEHDQLLKLVIEPIADELKKLQATKGSPLQAAIQELIELATEPVQQYQKEIEEVCVKVRKGFRGVFPELDVEIRVAMDAFTIDASKELTAGSSVRFIQGESDTNLKQQGTGSRRALFWTLMQVRNLLQREKKRKDDLEKQKEAQAKSIEAIKGKIQKEKERDKPSEAKLLKLMQDLEQAEKDAAPTEDQLALPGHILLIDEPENALHPLAVRLARDNLYSLARDPNWQVMLSTHSPYFIDPLEDHTTILRIERNGKNTTPRTYRTATAQFSPEDRANLRALLQLDIALAEMFFGSYPIIVEGDTEMAAFFAAVGEETEALQSDIVLVPARGKALIPPLIRLLSYFEIDFGVLHDSDAPMLPSGKKNGAWTVNRSIVDAIIEARKKGVTVRHRISIPDFERLLGGLEESNDKPILAYRKVQSTPEINAKVQHLFMALSRSDHHQYIEGIAVAATADQIMESLRARVQEWAQKEAPGNPCFKFPD
jgi:putative ATP-dependent endonuclease of the OLD family